MAKPFPSLPHEWEQFLLCLIFHLSLPLLPLGIEQVVRGSVTDTSLTLGTAMYALSIGGSSRNSLQFGFSVAISILYSILFGLSTAASISGKPGPTGNGYAVYALVAVFVFHGVERYNKHVAARMPYWEFSSALTSKATDSPEKRQ